MELRTIKILSVLLAAAIITAVFAAVTPAVIGQGQPGGSLSLPGLGLSGFSTDGNQVSLSVSIASQEGSKIYFLVNKIAIASPGAQAATVYELSGALPGVVDTSGNSLQVDLSQISSYMQGPRQVSMSDLYGVMRPDPKVLLIRFNTGPASTQNSQVVFQVNSVDFITPDGSLQTFTMSQPVSLVYDQSSQRLYTVGFSEMYSFFSTFITNVQNNYYTTVVNNITVVNVITVTPPVFFPVVSPIVFPTPFPVIYPVPFPVPFPTVKPSVTPTVKPSATPTGMPTGTPKPTGTATPTGMPTGTPKPTVTGTPKPTVTGVPTGTPKPTVTKAPTGVPTGTLKPTLKPTGFPTGIPTGTLKPTGFPVTLKPTMKPSLAPTGKPTGFPVTMKPTFGPTGKPTMIGPTKLPFTTAKPPVSTIMPPSGPAKPTVGLPGGIGGGAGKPAMPTVTAPGGGRIGATMAPGI